MVKPPRIGLVGLGNMGASIATRLAHNADVIGFDPQPGAAARELHQANKLKLATAVAELSGADAIILSLPSPPISLAVVTELAPLLGRGGIIIETSTVTPADMQRAAAVVQETGGMLVDAAILAGTGPMVAGNAVLLVGGDPSDIEAARPTLQLFSNEITVLGPLGAGMAAKVINNAVAHSVMVVLAEAASLAAANGIPRASLAELLASDDGGLIRPLVHRYRERMLSSDFEGGMPTDAARKDSTLALDLAQASGVPLFAIQSSHAVYEMALAMGLGKQDYSSITTLWETWTGRPMRDGDETQ